MAGLASLGLPGMNGFIGEFLVFIGAFRGLAGRPPSLRSRSP